MYVSNGRDCFPCYKTILTQSIHIINAKIFPIWHIDKEFFAKENFLKSSIFQKNT